MSENTDECLYAETMPMPTISRSIMVDHDEIVVSVMSILPNSTFCIDLTSGRESALSADVSWVQWTKKPKEFVPPKGCHLRGVLRIRLHSSNAQCRST